MTLHAVQLIEERRKLYRVTDELMGEGLWYDVFGHYSGLIHTVEGAPAAALPMGHHDIFRSDGRKWLSATETIEQLRNWFGENDMRQLVSRGYTAVEIEVQRYRRLTFEAYTHEVFCIEDQISIRRLDISAFHPTLANVSLR